VLILTSKQYRYTLVLTFDKFIGDFMLFIENESDGAKLFVIILAMLSKPIIYILRNKS